MQGSKNREWLIKSSGEIRGPFTFDEIAQGIACKDFIVVDEISKKFSRWKYLRDEEVFEKVILEHKNSEFSKGEKTFTNSETDSQTEELGDKVVSFSGKGSLLSNVKEHLKEKEESRITNQKVSAAKARHEEVKSYAAESQLKRKTTGSNPFSTFIIFLLVMGGVASMYYYSKMEKPLSYDDLKKIAYENINYGSFEDSKIYLEKALAVNSTNEELKYLLSYVSLELNDTVTSQRLLSDLIRTGSDTKLKAQSLNLNGILHIKNFNLKEANQNFKEALMLNPKFSAASFNMGVTYYLENKFDQANENFQQSIASGGVDGNILLSLVEMHVRQIKDWSNPEKKKQIDEDLSTINRQSMNLPSYRQELKVAAAYMYYHLDNKELMEKYIDEALNVDPALTADHVSDVTYYKGLVTWDRIAEWIKKMKDAHPKNESLNTFYGYALFKGSDKLKGKDVIEGLLKSNYTNTSNQIIHSYILMTLKREEEARAALAPIMHHRDKSLSFVLMGKLCLLKKDYPCADLNFSEALRIDRTNVSAQAGLSEVYFELKDYVRSRELMKLVYNISPTYRPILRVKKKLEKENKI